MLARVHMLSVAWYSIPIMLAAVSMAMEFPFVCRAATMAHVTGPASYVLELTLRVPKSKDVLSGNPQLFPRTLAHPTRALVSPLAALLNPGRVSWKQGTREVKRPVR